jgi:hypothetical protein
VSGATLGIGLPALTDGVEAQTVCLPSTPSTYAPTPPSSEPEPNLQLDDGFFDPAASGNIAVEGAVIGLEYCAIVYSAPINLGNRIAQAPNGRLEWGMSVPADFELNAIHRLEVYRQGLLKGAFNFCVNLQGNLAPVSACSSTGSTTSTTGPGGSTTSTAGPGGSTSTTQVGGGGNNQTTTTARVQGNTNTTAKVNPNKGSLPRTGLDRLFEILRAAAAAIAVGVFLMYLRRRRAAAIAA